MTPEDKALLARLKPLIRPGETVGILSPVRGGEYQVFDRFTALPKWRWNLDRPGRRRYDWLIASNVFMYSPEPVRWLRNVLACCRYFALIDLVQRQRSREAELGADGDRTRYRIDDVEPRLPGYFDLRPLAPLASFTYPSSGNEYDAKPVHAMAVFAGRTAVPLLRLDDYPSGVRPVPADLRGLHGVLEAAEAAGVRYHLSIVPGILTAEMTRFLRTLKHMVPLVHGFDHGYPRYAPRLLANGDLTNDRTVHSFDEFAFDRRSVVLEKLTRAKRIVEDACETKVTGFVPPCNRGNRRVAAALHALGFEYYLSERRIPGCRLPWIRSDFYGRSHQFPTDGASAVSTLHVTWEWDLIRNGESRLKKVLAALRARQDEARREQQALSDAVAGIAREVRGTWVH